MCSKCLAEEIEDLKAKVKKEADWTDYWRRLCELKADTVSELRVTLKNTKAELSDAQSDLADTTTTLDKYRRANSELTEERDLSRELFQGMVSAYADLLDRYAKMCDDYDGLVSRYDDLLLRCDFEHDED